MTENAALSALVPRLAAARVLCVGDLMLDRFLYGEVERVSPEAPVPVLRVSRESTMLGGAGNVVRNLVALGARATFVATIGNDRAGSTLATLVDAEARVDARLMRTAGRASTIKSRYLAAGQQLLRADRDPDRPIGDSVAADLADAAAAAVPDCDAAVLSDYGKGVVGEAVIGAVLAAAAAHGKPVIVDPKGEDFSRYRSAGTVTPNRAELAAASGAPTDDDEAVARAARRLIADLDIGRVLVTRGAAGMSLVTAGEAAHFPARAREVFDVSGAGDTAVAAFAAAFDQNRQYGKWKLVNIADAPAAPSGSGIRVSDDDSPYVRFSNIFDFQGLESDLVILVLPMAPGQTKPRGIITLPHYNYLNRLLYIAMSRANAMLIVMADEGYKVHLQPETAFQLASTI